MDPTRFLRAPLSRRRFLRVSGTGAAAGCATVLAACGAKPSGSVTTPRLDTQVADVDVLNGVLDLELRGIAAYKQGAALLKGTQLGIVKEFLEHEQAHVDALSSAIRGAGGTPNRARASYRFDGLRSAHDVLTFAVSFENDQVAAYIDALPKLSDSKLRGTASAIMTTDAEHIAVLREALGMQASPAAFVTGEVT